MIKNVFLAFVIFLTVSCAGTVKLDDVKIDTSKVKTETIEGNFAVFIQNDDWIMKSSSKENFWTGYCPSFESTSNLKPVFSQTMNDIVNSTFQNIKFVSSELSTEQIVDGGFDALISITHAEATSNFTSQYVVLGFKLKTTTNIGVEFKVKGKNGKEYSKVSKSSGQGSDFSISAFICSNSDGVQEAIKSSFPKIAEMGMLSLKTGIISVRD